MSNSEQLYKIYQSFPKWDDFIFLNYEKKEVRKMRFSGFLDHLYEPEYEEVYTFDLNASLESVHQIYHLNPKFDVLRRRELEFLYVPGIFHIYLFWRTNVQGLRDWDVFSNARKQRDWSYKEISGDAINVKLSEIVEKFLSDSEAAVESTIKNLRP